MLTGVSTATAIVRGPDLRASPATRCTPVGRLAAAGTLALGAAFQLAAFIREPQHDEAVDRFEWIAENPNRADLAKLFDVLAMALAGGAPRARSP